MTGTGTMQIDHAKMRAVVDRLDRLIESLNSSGNAGSYASLAQAGQVAQAVCTVAEPEMATFVKKYNYGFGAAAQQYQSLCTTLVSIRNAVAQTANIHLDNDVIQADAFDPLKDDGLNVHGGVDLGPVHLGGHDANVTPGTTAPGNQAGSDIPLTTDTGSGDSGTTDTGSGDTGSDDGGSGTTTLAPGPLDGTQTHSTDPTTQV